MSERSRSASGVTRRIGVLADGYVGNAILSELVNYAPDALIALMINDESVVDSLELPASCDLRHWQPKAENAMGSWFKAKELDIIILAWWPFLIKGALLDAAPVILNTHPSFLPYCRGKDPNFWSIVEGAPYGVTIHHVNSEIDSGAIAFQKEIPISWSDTGGSLYEKGLAAMVSLFREALPVIVHGDIPHNIQKGQGTIHYRKQLAEASLIDLDTPVAPRELLNRLRARTFPPHPGCRFYDGEKLFEVRVHIEEITSGD